MGQFNQITLVGRLTRDPEKKTFAGGGAETTFGFATKGRSKKGQSGEWEDEPMFIDCKCRNRQNGRQLADTAANYLSKGKEVMIVGKLILEQWNDKNTGEKRRAHKIEVEEIIFVGAKDDNSGGGNRQQRQQSNHNNNGGGGYDGGYDGGGSYDEQPPIEDGIPF